MNQEDRQTYRRLNTSYFFIFFAFGAFFPMLTTFLEKLHFNGSQIGYITSIGPIISIISQPMWGMLSDRTQKHKLFLFCSIIAVAAIALLFPVYTNFMSILLLVIAFHIFQAPITPLSDTIALNFAQQHKLSYGDIRLWGAIGFAIAAYVTGQIVDLTNQNSMFYVIATSLLCSLFFLHSVPFEGKRTYVNVWSGMKELIRIPRYLFFLLAAFFIFGAMNANNYYFGIYYQHIGGSLTLVGVAFFLAAGSEAPVMRLAGKIINRIGLINCLLLAATFSLLRWILFYFVHQPLIILSFFFLQGLSIGLFLAVAPQFVRETTPRVVQVTALTLYTAFGSGLGTFVCNLLGGWIYNYFSIYMTYVLFACFTIAGVLCLIVVKKMKAYH